MPQPPLPQKKCDYCRELYTPTRRWGQKYCRDACRVNACNQRAGRPHPKATKAASSRGAAGRTPSAVVPAAALVTNQQILATMAALGDRLAVLERQQQELLDLLRPQVTALQ